MYERINVRGMISGGIMIVLSLAMASNAGDLLSVFRNPLFYVAAAVLAYNAIEPRIRRRSKSR